MMGLSVRRELKPTYPLHENFKNRWAVSICGRFLAVQMLPFLSRAWISLIAGHKVLSYN